MSVDNPLAKPSWRRLRRWLVEGAILLLALYLVHLWQTRDSVQGPAPALSAQLLSGAPFSLETPRDKPLLIYFWATWCPVCKLTSSNIDALTDSHQVVTVAMQSGDADAIAAYLREKGLHFPVIADPQGRISSVWRVKGVPTVYLVDTHGDIRFVSVGYISTLGIKARLWLAGSNTPSS
jgi:thiol-disulfide isomerase/thioredoxin